MDIQSMRYYKYIELIFILQQIEPEAIYYIHDYFKSEHRATRYSDTISGLFIWSKTDQGIDYWATLHDKVELFRDKHNLL